MTGPYPDPATRRLISGSTMLAAVMSILDSTIATVALPHIQSNLGASSEQVVWVLTSYVIAGAVATPLSAWLASRFGRKLIMVASVTGFTTASVACGLAANLYALVLFRFLQGLTGAAMIPLSQATLLDINPPESQGKAMALFGAGSMLGGVLGPSLGGLLTDYFSWRAVFLINVPIGIISAIGMSSFMSETKSDVPPRFDMMGFIALSLFLTSLQLMIDRGNQLDWFDSPEIWLEAGAAAFCGYVFLVHIFTTDAPFISPALFKDRNFAVGSMVGTMLGVLIFGAMPLLAVMLQQILGYPVLKAAILGSPRGIGNLMGMVIVSRMMGKVDTRTVVVVGLLILAWSFYMMAGMSLEMDQGLILSSGLMLGIGSGLIFVPLSIVVFSTLNPALRNEGAAVFSLSRNLGTAVGISALQIMTIRNGAAVQSRLVEGVRPDNPNVAMAMPDLDFASASQMLAMHYRVAQQAIMVSYTRSFQFLMILSVLAVPLVFLLRGQKQGAAAAPVVLAE